MRRFLVAAALCAASLGASAQAVFNFTFSGTGSVTPCPQQQCGGTQFFPFFGTAIIETSSFADGTYSGASLLQMSWSSLSMAGSFDIHDPKLEFLIAPSVTLLGGQVVAAYAANQKKSADDIVRSFNGLSVFASGNFGQGTGINATAPLVAVVPEPSTWALMAGGVALLGFLRRRHGVASKLVRPR